MRDPKRIDKFLEEFGKYWKEVPDWRFMQLICNLPFKRDPFFIEEEELLDILEDFFHSSTDENKWIIKNIDYSSLSYLLIEE